MLAFTVSVKENNKNMPVTTICVQPVSGDGMFDEVEEGDFQIVTSHPSEMGYVPSMRRRCAQANVLSDLTDDQLSKLHTLYKTLEQVNIK